MAKELICLYPFTHHYPLELGPCPPAESPNCCLATSIETESPRSLFLLEPITLRVLLGGGSEMRRRVMLKWLQDGVFQDPTCTPAARGTSPLTVPGPGEGRRNQRQGIQLKLGLGVLRGK